MTTHRETTDPQVERLLKELIALTERMEARLNEIKDEVGGFGNESDGETSAR